MKTTNRNDFLEIGSIVKVHGTKGEVKVILSSKINFKEWAFLEIREKPVPFYLEGCKHQYEEEAFLKFEGVNEIEAASKLVGHKLLVAKKGFKKSKSGDVGESVLNYKIIDHNFGLLGVVEKLVENSMQSLIQTTYNSKELLIPAIEPILTDIDDDKQVVYVNIPEGLLEI